MLTVCFVEGGDGAQVFGNIQYGCLIIGIKVLGLPAALAAKNFTWAPLAIVEGRTEPSCNHGLMVPYEIFFAKRDVGVVSAALSVGILCRIIPTVTCTSV